jgi:mono/diheme cytochrome c family protein
MNARWLLPAMAFVYHWQTHICDEHHKPVLTAQPGESLPAPRVMCITAWASNEKLEFLRLLGSTLPSSRCAWRLRTWPLGFQRICAHWDFGSSRKREGGHVEISINKRHLVGCLVLGFLGVLLSAAGLQEGQPKAEQNKKAERLIPSVKGPDLFRAYCSPCHGEDGKGNGPVAPALNAKPADLTTIAQRNGGTFPVKRVRSIIAGDDLILAHGSREMPIWGPIFHQVEWDRDFGEIRLQNITKYLESIQKK